MFDCAEASALLFTGCSRSVRIEAAEISPTTGEDGKIILLGSIPRWATNGKRNAKKVSEFTLQIKQKLKKYT